MEQVQQQPLHQGGDHRQVQAVSGQGGAGGRHEDLCQAGRSQCGDGALLLLLIRVTSIELASNQILIGEHLEMNIKILSIIDQFY